MRIAIAGFAHESNTFASKPTELSDFGVTEGVDVVAAYADTFHEIAGYIVAADELGFELCPLFSASATPAGAVTSEAYEHFTGRIADGLGELSDVDGILLALHGAMVAEDFPQADGETVRRVRELVGSDVPIVVTHDYHGNVPEQLVQDSDALIIYKTNPHIDQKERGQQAASILVRQIRGEVKPVSAIAKPEVLFNIYYHNTSVAPMQPLMQAAIELENTPGILGCSIAAGYQYADVPFMGPSIVVVADGDEALAQRECDRLADMMWAVREQLIADVPDPAAAVRAAMASDSVPVALMDFGDNIGGGSAGDATFVLEQLLEQGADGWVVTLWDPEAAQACARAGIGAVVSLRVGGKTDDMHGPTLSVNGNVRTIHDGTYEETERRHGGGRHHDQGLTAVVGVGRSGTGNGGLLVLNSERSCPNSIHQITCVGIQPHQQKILVAKGAVAPRAAYEPVSSAIMEVDSGGATAIHRPASDYQLARTNLYEWRENS